MTKRLGETSFRDLLAHSIADDPSIRAAADALDSVLAETTRNITDILIYGRLAHDSKFVDPVDMLKPMERLTSLKGELTTLPDGILDLLAWQLHVDNYDTTVDRKAKLELVAVSMILHHKKGTAWAVRHALDIALQLSSPSVLTQWFEYGGDPYFFRVYLDISDYGMDPEEVTSAVKLILEHKNVRSWLEWLRTQTIRELPTSIGTASVTRSINKVRLHFPPKPIAPPHGYIAVASVVRIMTATRLYIPNKMTTASPQKSRAFSLQLTTRSKVWPQQN